MLSCYKMELNEVHHGKALHEGQAYAFKTEALEEYKDWMAKTDGTDLKVECCSIKQIKISKEFASRLYSSGSLLVTEEKPDGDLGAWQSRRPGYKSRSRH